MSPSVVLLLAAAVSATPPETLVAANEPIELDFTEVSKWWKWTNFPSLDPSLGPMLTRSTKPIVVNLAYTIGSNGTVGDCAVLNKSDPELDDGELCEMISLREYQPSKSNATRRSVRTSTELRMGPPGMSPADLTGDLPE